MNEPSGIRQSAGAAGPRDAASSDRALGDATLRAAAPPDGASIRSQNGSDRRRAQLGERRGRGSGLLRWRLDRLVHGVPATPPSAAFPRHDSDPARPRPPAGELRITWVGHSSLLVQVGGLNLLTDPMWSRRASPFRRVGPARLVEPGLPLEAVPEPDAVVLSHDHYDHLDDATVRHLAALWPRLPWLTPPGYEAWLRARGVREVVERAWWETAELSLPGGRLEATAAPAQHWTSRGPGSRNRRGWGSWAVRAGGASFYFGGDSGYFDGYPEIGRRLGPFDAVALPIGAYAPRWFMRRMHMDPEEAVTVYGELGGRGVFVGIHWGTFRLSDEPPLEPPVRTAAAWRTAGLPPDDLWILAHGETRTRQLELSAGAEAGGARA